MSSRELLKLHRLEVWIEARPLLKGLEGVWNTGDRTALVGVNGGGKSVFLRSVAHRGNLESSHVHAQMRGSLEGVPVEELTPSEWYRSILYLGSNLRTEFVVTLQDYLENSLRLIPRTEWKDRVDQALVRLGLEGLRYRPLQDFSTGELQRALIARALVLRPKVLMLDETFSGLDLHFQEECIRALKELSDSAQILVSHDLRSALRWAKQVWILHEGKWAYQGPIDEVRVPRALSEIYPGLMFHMRHDQIEWMRKT